MAEIKGLKIAFLGTLILKVIITYLSHINPETNKLIMFSTVFILFNVFMVFFAVIEHKNRLSFYIKWCVVFDLIYSIVMNLHLNTIVNDYIYIHPLAYIQYFLAVEHLFIGTFIKILVFSYGVIMFIYSTVLFIVNSCIFVGNTLIYLFFYFMVLVISLIKILNPRVVYDE